VIDDIIPNERPVKHLSDTEFDLLVSGAGMFGACAAWDAALRGYKVAIIDRGDYCSGVSANSYKIVHGGIRYIQHLDVPRVRGSCHERSTLLRIAPHLVHPLPIAIPTYGYGLSGKPVLAAGMYLYDLLTADRNRSIPSDERRIPWSRLMSRQEILEKFPGLNKKGLTGAAVFSDAQIYNPPRLILSFVLSAAAKGATVCNYLSLEGFRRSGNKIAAARVRDALSGDTFEIRAKTYLNTTGPWTDRLLDGDEDTRESLPGVYSRDACFVVKRQFEHEMSVALMAQTRDPDAFLSRPARHIFVVPWRDYSLIGTWHKVVEPSPDAIGITGDEIDNFIDEIRSAYPDLSLSRDDVTMCNWGLVPFGEDQSDAQNLSYGKRSILVDHAADGGPDNLVSLVGIRVTMGRGDAAVAMRSIARKLGDDRKPPATNEVPIYGGDDSDIPGLIDRVRRLLPNDLDPRVAESLARNYGSKAEQLISGAAPDQLRTIGDSHVVEAEVTHAVRNEMAMSVADVALRRTDLASGGLPDSAALDRCTEIVAAALELTPQQAQEQKDAVARRIPGWTR
jgi:glycerol-3-phosphate dehydrogenase